MLLAEKDYFEKLLAKKKHFKKWLVVKEVQDIVIEKRNFEIELAGKQIMR